MTSMTRDNNENCISSTELKELQQLASTGDSDAQFELGLYYFGRGLRSRTLGPAIKWYRKAADGGHCKALVNLGCLYQNGLGVQQDAKQARRLFLRAARRGDGHAMLTLSHSYLADGGKKARDRALYWLLRLSAMDDTISIEACAWLGECLLADNTKQGVMWLRRAANSAHTLAMLRLAGLYKEGTIVRKDLGAALRWYFKAASEPRAALEIGKFYLEGHGVAKNSKEAVRWLKKSSSKGEAEAFYHLGICYRHGLGVRKNSQVARRMLARAVKLGYDRV